MEVFDFDNGHTTAIAAVAAQARVRHSLINRQPVQDSAREVLVMGHCSGGNRDDKADNVIEPDSRHMRLDTDEDHSAASQSYERRVWKTEGLAARQTASL